MDPLLTRITAFNQKWPHAQNGPAHIVLADFNVKKEHIQWCLDLLHYTLHPQLDPGNYRSLLHSTRYYHTHSQNELRATHAFLKRFLRYVHTSSQQPQEASLC